MGETPRRHYAGYRRRRVPAPDAELTGVGPDTPMGELLRRAWQPVALASQITDVALPVRVLGEDLVAFRDGSGRIGVLHRHCSHRGASLEFGIVETRGLRCCYHGWLYGVDGQVLETPGEPPASRLKDKVEHGAYPAVERDGLVFAYLGAPETEPAVPVYDTFVTPGDARVPFSLWHPCNWLQVYENFVDPIHTIFLHSDYREIQLSAAYAARPELSWQETDDGMLVVSARRLAGDLAWIRLNHVALPNFVQVGTLYEGGEPRPLSRAGITRWIVPADDGGCTIFGWRHFNEGVASLRAGDPAACGVDRMDAVGQSGNRDYGERQRNPGDWDVVVGQRQVAVHALENLASTDTGVAMLRRLLRRAARGEGALRLPRAGAPAPTYTGDSVIKVPRGADDADDRARLRAAGAGVVAAIAAAASLLGAPRAAEIERRIAALSGAPSVAAE